MCFFQFLKELKSLLRAEPRHLTITESPHLRFSDADGKEYDFGTQLPSSSPGSLKVDDTGKKIFAVSGLISDRETSSSPEDRNDRCKYFGCSPLLAPSKPASQKCSTGWPHCTCS